MKKDGSIHFCPILTLDSGFPDQIILYDGYCNLCSGSVQFILKHEKNPVYYFLSLQSPIVQKLLPEFEVKNPPESIILIENEKVFMASDAALKISRKLKFPWRIAYYFIYFPRFLRDPIYHFIAKNRYKYFEKKSSCFIPESKWKRRFLD